MPEFIYMYAIVTTAWLLKIVVDVCRLRGHSAALTAGACVILVVMLVAVSGLLVLAHRALTWVV